MLCSGIQFETSFGNRAVLVNETLDYQEAGRKLRLRIIDRLEPPEKVLAPDVGYQICGFASAHCSDSAITSPSFAYGFGILSAKEEIIEPTRRTATGMTNRIRAN
ncbi:hypothetical protein ABW19_dt0210219 [Dactylella cylindrospora]|nr:hypothetical protein ABW19_dt0210219 [Dactylella cylindrospora]